MSRRYRVLRITEKAVKLNLIVDKSCNRLIFAESDEHFVDILFSFLTLPLASILQLTKQPIGSINNVLKSVESLDSNCFNSEACRSMLLHPSNSASNLPTYLPIQYDNVSNLFHFYYTCSSCFSSNLCFYDNAHCPCGGLLNIKLQFAPDSASSNAYSSAFFSGAFIFIISDDLLVSQSSLEFSIEQLSKLDIKQRSCLQSLSVEVTTTKVLDLLKRVLVSDTPLTHVFLGVHKHKDVLEDIQQPLRAPNASSTRNISLKLYVDEDRVVIAEADNDFVDLLFGFLTYPMSVVISKLRRQLLDF